MKKKIGASKSMKKYGPGGIADSGPGSKSTSKDVDKLPPMSAPPTGTGYMKKGGSVKNSKQQAAIAIAMKAKGKKPKMAMGGTPKFDRKEPSDNMMKSNKGPLTDIRMAKAPAPNPTAPTYPATGVTPPKKITGTNPAKAKMGGMVKKISKKK